MNNKRILLEFIKMRSYRKSRVFSWLLYLHFYQVDVDGYEPDQGGARFVHCWKIQLFQFIDCNQCINYERSLINFQLQFTTQWICFRDFSFIDQSFFYWFILLSTFELLKRQIWSSPLSLLIYSVQVMASNSVIKIFRFGSKVDNLILPI